jgi:hypothetical protein
VLAIKRLHRHEKKTALDAFGQPRPADSGQPMGATLASPGDIGRQREAILWRETDGGAKFVRCHQSRHTAKSGHIRGPTNGEASTLRVDRNR